MTDQERNEFWKWAEQKTVPVGFDRVEAILNSLNNAFDAEDQLQCAKSTFNIYVDQGVSCSN